MASLGKTLVNLQHGTSLVFSHQAWSQLAQRTLGTSVNGLCLPSRGRRRPRGQFIIDENDVEWTPDGVDIKRQAENVASMDVMERRQYQAEQERERKRQKNFIKNKIIERKYFRPFPATNILFWRAKQQIKHLYSESPDAEGLVSIMEIFPIAEKDLHLLLRQKGKIMKNSKEIFKHDYAVYKKWKAIDEGNELSSSLRHTLDALVASGQIRNMTNACGAEHIEQMPSETYQDIAHRALAAPGTFTKLLMKHSTLRLRSTQPNLKVGEEDALTPYSSRNYQSLLSRIQAKYSKDGD